MKLAILVLAAGYSRRFKQIGAEHKLLALLKGKPILQHTLDNAWATGMDVFVITRPEDRQIHSLCKGTYLVKCSSNGIGDSIAAGVKACANYDGWLITLADMPFITTASYLAVSQTLQHYPMVRTNVNGVLGHPVGFQKKFYSALTRLAGDVGARTLMEASSLSLIHLTDLGCLQDIDTFSDLCHFNNPT